MKAWSILAVLLVGTAVAQERQPQMVQPNTIYVSAEGKYESAPDTALVQFNIAAQEETSKAAYERASRAAEQIRQILRSNGVDPKSAEVGFFSIQPVYDWRSPKRKLLGYRVSSNVTLKLKDFSKISGIVQQLADMDVTESQSISYTLEDIDAAKVKAVQDAFQRARAEAAALAVAGGRALGELSHASVDTFEPPSFPPQPMTMRAAAADMAEKGAPPTGEFTPQKIRITARVNTMFTLK